MPEMTEIKPDETQQEFFGEFSKEPKRPERLSFVPKTQKPILVNTSAEQIILGGIVLILAGCFIFFLGMIRGKSLSAQWKAERVVQQGVMPKPSGKTLEEKTASTVLLAKPVTAIPNNSQTPLVTQNLAKPYTIQLATYKKQDLAEKEVAALRRAGFFSFIITSGDYYVVCAGQYENKDGASKDLKFFGSKYKGCYLRRR